MATKRENELKKIESALLAMRKAGNSKILDEDFAIKNGCSVEGFSEYSARMAWLYLTMRDYVAPRRNEVGVSAESLSKKERDALHKAVDKAWSKVLELNPNLTAQPEDVEMLWHAIERVEKIDKKVVVGVNTPKRFRRQVEIELGLRLADIKSKSEIELEFDSSKQRLNNRIKSLEKACGDQSEILKKWVQTLEMFADATPEQKQVVETLRKTAEQEYEAMVQDLESARDELAKLEAGGLDGVKEQIANDVWKSIKAFEEAYK